MHSRTTVVYFSLVSFLMNCCVFHLTLPNKATTKNESIRNTVTEHRSSFLIQYGTRQTDRAARAHLFSLCRHSSLLLNRFGIGALFSLPPAVYRKFASKIARIYDETLSRPTLIALNPSRSHLRRKTPHFRSRSILRFRPISTHFPFILS
jgi:hypothetical protein